MTSLAIPNARFAAFFDKRKKESKKSLLKKNDTSGACIVGMIDSVRRMPAKRSPGSFYITVFTNKTKVFDDTMFKLEDGVLTIQSNDDNPEERVINEYDTIIIGTFDVPDKFENMSGTVVKCDGFIRNNKGYLTCKAVRVSGADKIDSALSLGVQIPEIDFDNCEEKYKGTILQFKYGEQDHKDWSHTVGNACSLNIGDEIDKADFMTDDNEMIFKGSADAMSFASDNATRMSLVEIYWPRAHCVKFGITNKDFWPVLGPKILQNFRGFVKANIDIVGSSGLQLNDPDSGRTLYSKAYKVYSNVVEVDLASTIVQAGEEMTSQEVFKYFDEELMLEYEDASDNPLNDSSSLIKNLNEYNGVTQKIIDAEGAKFYKVCTGPEKSDSWNIFCILKTPLTKKRKK